MGTRHTPILAEMVLQQLLVVLDGHLDGCARRATWSEMCGMAWVGGVKMSRLGVAKKFEG
jgi:hypothetical protein